MSQVRYPHPLIDRYASPEMADIFSPRRQAATWRQLWIALAEAQKDLGVEIPDAAIGEMRAVSDQIDLSRVAELESRLRHDVMAHIHHFGEPGDVVPVEVGGVSIASNVPVRARAQAARDEAAKTS